MTTSGLGATSCSTTSAGRYSPGAVQQGLAAEYWTSDTTYSFDGVQPTMVRVDPNIAFDWGSGSPDVAVSSNTFSARWMGLLTPRYNETYTFYATADDGVRLYINDALLINSWGSATGSELSGAFAYPMTTAQTYFLVVHYMEKTGGAAITVRWSSPSQSKQTIPQSALTALPRDVYCPSGSASSSSGMASAAGCVVCAAGSYASRGESTCKQCVANTYSDSSGSTSCTSCGSGLSSGAGSTSKSACSNDSGAIVGGIIGGTLGAGILAAVLIIFFSKRAQAKRAKERALREQMAREEEERRRAEEEKARQERDAKEKEMNEQYREAVVSTLLRDWTGEDVLRWLSVCGLDMFRSSFEGAGLTGLALDDMIRTSPDPSLADCGTIRDERPAKFEADGT